jgi:hypothetical protein
MLSNNHVLQLFRTSNNSIYRSVSHNSGVTWSDARPIDIPNPDSKINVLQLRSASSSSNLALAFNDNPLRENKRVRFDRGRRVPSSPALASVEVEEGGRANQWVFLGGAAHKKHPKGQSSSSPAAEPEKDSNWRPGLPQE